MMKRPVFLCCCAVLWFNANSQEGFYKDTTLLSGKSIEFIDFASAEGIVTTSEQEVFLISKDLSITDLTSSFQDFAHASFLSVAFEGPDLFFIGTASDSLLVYRDGIVSQIGSRQGLTAAEVNSMRIGGGSLLMGTEKSRFRSVYPYDTVESVYFGSSADRREVLLSPNPYTIMYKVEDDPYCGNMKNLELWNEYATGTAVAGLNTHDSLTGKEVVRDALLLGSGGRFIWNYSSFIYGSNYGLRWSDLCAWDGSYVPLIDSTAINDIMLFNLSRQFDFPDIIFVAADRGAYYVENLYNINEMKTTKIVELGNTKVNCLEVKNVICDFSVWMGTEAGLVKYTSAEWDVSYTRNIPDYYERMWCQDDVHHMSPLSSGLFDYQWLKDGQPVPNETSYSLNDFGPGFYQLVYSNCHLHDTLNVATYILDQNVDADIGYNNTTACTNEYLSLYVSSDNEQTYQWYRDNEIIPGATASYYSPIESGSYKVEATNCNNFSATSQNVDITIHPVETPELDLSYFKENYCEGDTLRLLEPDSGVSITWNGFGESYTAFENKSYIILSDEVEPRRVTYTTSEGCEEKMNLPYIRVNDMPELYLTADTLTICDDIPRYLEVFGNASDVYWSDGNMGHGRYFDSTGIYTVYAENYYGCISEPDTLIVTEVKSPDFQLMEDTTLSFGDSLIIEGPEGYDEYYWNGHLGEKDFFFKPAKAGFFHISLSLSNGECIRTESVNIEVIKHVLLGTSSSEGFKIYPNPAHDVLQVRGDKLLAQNIRIIALSGKDMTNLVRIDGSGIVNISGLRSGIYFILIKEHEPIKFYKI